MITQFCGLVVPKRCVQVRSEPCDEREQRLDPARSVTIRQVVHNLHDSE